MIGDDDPTPAGCMRRPDAWGHRLAGVFVVAIDPAAFGDAAEYRRRVGEVLDDVDSVAPAPGVAAVLVPGDPERASRERRARGGGRGGEGILVPASRGQERAAIAGRFGVQLPPRGQGFEKPV